MCFKPIVFLLVLSAVSAAGQSLEAPEDLVRAYFNNKLPDFKMVLVGEAREQHYNPKDLGAEVSRDFEMLNETDSTAVVAVTLTEGERFSDVYVYLRKRKEWMIKSFRGLWLPGNFYGMLEEFQGLDSAGIVSKYGEIIAKAQAENPEMPASAIIAELGTAEHFLTEIYSMRLIVSSDKDLMAHFRNHAPAFKQILRSIATDRSIPDTGTWQLSADDPYWKPHLDAILISHVSGIGKPAERIDFTIGGMIDNTVGYFYCKERKDLPEMSDQRFIVIRELGEGWYMYKTT